MSGSSPASARGMTPREVAARWRKSPGFVRNEVRSGRLQALNFGTLSRPRLVILPEHIAAYEARLTAAAAPAPLSPVKRLKRRANEVDFFPD